MLSCPQDSLLPVRSLANDLDVRLRNKKLANIAADNFMVIHNQHSKCTCTHTDPGVSVGLRGMSAWVGERRASGGTVSVRLLMMRGRQVPTSPRNTLRELQGAIHRRLQRMLSSHIQTKYCRIVALLSNRCLLSIPPAYVG